MHARTKLFHLPIRFTLYENRYYRLIVAVKRAETRVCTLFGPIKLRPPPSARFRPETIRRRGV